MHEGIRNPGEKTIDDIGALEPRLGSTTKLLLSEARENEQAVCFGGDAWIAAFATGCR
jgi:hypothetical protein